MIVQVGSYLRLLGGGGLHFRPPQQLIKAQPQGRQYQIPVQRDKEARRAEKELEELLAQDGLDAEERERLRLLHQQKMETMEAERRRRLKAIEAVSLSISVYTHA
jgi:hypothetical protein